MDSPIFLGSLAIVLVIFVITLMIYMIFGRTEILRNKLLNCLKSFDQVNDINIKKAGSKYFETLDASFSLCLVRDDARVYLIKCDTHGQLANNYYLVLDIENTENFLKGIYGSGRIPRVLRRYKINMNELSYSELNCSDEIKQLIYSSESLEVTEDKVFLFFPLGSLFGYGAIFELSKYLEN